MLLKVPRETLLKPLQMAASVTTDKKPGNPILSHVLMKIHGECLSIMGSDLEIELMGSAQLASVNGAEFEDLEITLPAKKLLDICRSFPDEALITIKIENQRAIVTSQRSRFVLATLPANEFPSMKGIVGEIEFPLPPLGLKTVMERLVFAMAAQDVRSYFNGMLFQANGDKLHLVASDGHRLALGVVSVAEKFPKEFSMIVPRKGIHEMIKFLTEEPCDVVMKLDSYNISVIGSSFIFTAKVIEGRYPSYQHIIPKQPKFTVTLEREALKQAVLRVVIVSSEKNRSIRFGLSPGYVVISTQTQEQEEAEERIPSTYMGESFETGLNATYLLDVLNTMTAETITMHCTDQKSGILIEDVAADCRHIIMPLY